MFQPVPQPGAIVEGLRTSVSSLLRAQERRERLQFALIFGAALILGPLLAWLALTRGFNVVFGVAVVVLVFLLIARWPLFGLYVVASCTLVVDWAPLPVHIGTDRLPVWAWPSGISSLPERPIGVVLLFILLVLLVQRLSQRQGGIQGGPLFWPFMVFLGTIALAAVHGLTTGGALQDTIMEVHPFEYLFLSYLLAYNLIAKKAHILLFFWLAIAGAAVKSLQGVYIVFTALNGHISGGQNEIMGHEDSFFFVALLLLIILFRLHYIYRPQLIAALVVLPPLLISLLANNRRADYVALVVGAGVAWLLIIVVRRDGRKRHIVALAACCVLGLGYVAAFSHATGTFAAPARAITSTFNPSSGDSRDYGSNQYRVIENFDLMFTERQSPLLGYGFGKPFLQPVPLANIAGLDPIYLYVPHNTIYWVWMRAGPLGFFALWYLFGCIIARGGLIARGLRDPYLQLVAIYAVALTFMEILISYADYQLFFFRTVIYVGLVVGMLMKLPALDVEGPTEVTEATNASEPRSGYGTVSRPQAAQAARP